LLVPLILGVAYYTYAERKIIGFIQHRIGPNRVGYRGLLQPFADLFKMMFKEVVIPTNSNRFLFVIAPIISLVPAFAVWAVVPLSDNFVIADIDAGLLYVRSEEHTSELQSRENLVCRLLLEKKKR